METTRKSAKAEGSLTARRTCRAEAKVGLSDPTFPCGRDGAQRIKASPGITGLSCPRVRIYGKVWHLDVGAADHVAGGGPKGVLVSPINMRETSDHTSADVY